MKTKIIDMHCDTITALKQQELYKNDLHISIEKLIEGNYLMQCFAIFIHHDATCKEPFNECNKYIDKFYQQIEKNGKYIKSITSIKDIDDTKLNALLTIEEGATIEGSLEKLEHFYNRGVRLMTLTWNYENEIAYPNNISMVDGSSTPNTTNGLKDFGYETVKKMNELGMIIDTSHLSDKGFYDVIHSSSKPIVASHSNARAICNVSRNLTDDMIRLLADKGGVMGLNYCPFFISSNTNENQIPAIVEHIKHIYNVGGITVCALGSDFDGIPTPNGMSDCTKMPLLYQALKDAKFTDNDIEAIFNKNFLRVFEANCH